QGRREILARRLCLAPCPANRCESRQYCCKGRPGRRCIPHTVPSTPETGDRLRNRPFGIRQEEIEEGFQLHQVSILGLAIDVPNERSCRPLRPHEGILSTHEVQIARPQ